MVKSTVVFSDGKHEGARIALGAIFCLLGWGLPLVQLFQGYFWEFFPTLLCLGPFGLCGFFVLRQSTGAWFDLETKALVTWSRVFGPRQETHTPLSAFKEIAIRRRSGSERVYYRVVLVSDEEVHSIRYSSAAMIANSTVKEVDVYSFYDLTNAEAKAAWLGQTLDLPLEHRQRRARAY